MMSQLPLPTSAESPERSPESIAEEIAVAQSGLRTMSPSEVLSLVNDLKDVFAQLDAQEHAPVNLQFAKNIILGQSKIKPMTSEDIVDFLKSLLAGASSQSSRKFLFVSLGKENHEWTKEEALAAMHEDPEYIKCLICNAKMKMLTKAHMKKHGMTMEEYRKRYNLHYSDVLLAKSMLQKRTKAMKNRALWETSPTYLRKMEKMKEEEERQKALQNQQTTVPANNDVKIKRTGKKQTEKK